MRQNWRIWPAPSIAAASYRSFWNRLDRGEVDQRVVTHPAPVHHRRDRDPGRADAGLPVDRLEAHEPEDPVDQAGVAAEELTEHDRDGGHRGDDRRENAEPEQHQASQRPVQQTRDDQRDHQLRDGREHEQAERVPERVPEVGVREKPCVVGGSDKTRVSGEVPLAQGDPGRVAEREQPEHGEQQEERRHEEVRRSVHVQPAPAAGLAALGIRGPRRFRAVGSDGGEGHCGTARRASARAFVHASSGLSLPCSTAVSASPTPSPMTWLSGPR